MVNLSQIKFFKPSSFFQGEVEERHYIKEKHKEPTGIRKVLLKTPFLRRIPFVRPGYKPGMVFVFWSWTFISACGLVTFKFAINDAVTRRKDYISSRKTYIELAREEAEAILDQREKEKAKTKN